MPELNALVNKYKNDDKLVFLAVTYDTKEIVDKFLSKRPFHYNIITDEEKTIIDNYGFTAYPTTLVIDKPVK